MHFHHNIYLSFQKLIYYILFQIICFSAYNQENYLTAKYRVTNGLLSNDNYRIYQDLNGYMWILSEKGLTKFNGFDFKYFTTLQGLKTNDVWDLFVDSKNRKWLVFFGHGIQYIENDTIKNLKESSKLENLICVGEHQDTIFFNQYDENRELKKRFFYSPGGVFKEYILKKNEMFLVYNFKDFGTQYFINNNKEIFKYNLVNQELIKKNVKLYSYDGYFLKENQPFFIYDNLKGGNRTIAYHENGDIIDLSSTFPSKELEKIHYDFTSKYIIIKTFSGYIVYRDFKKLDRDLSIEKILNELSILKGRDIAHLLIDNEKNLWVVENRGEIFFFPSTGFWYKRLLSDSKESVGNSFKETIRGDDDNYFVNKNNKIYQIDEFDHLKRLKLDLNTIRYYEYCEKRLLVLTDYYLYECNTKTDQKKIIYQSKNRMFKFQRLSEDKILIDNGDIVSLVTNKVVESLNYLPKKIRQFWVYDSLIICLTIKGAVLIDLKKNINKTINLKGIQDVLFYKNSLLVTVENKLYLMKLDDLVPILIYTSSYAIRHISFQKENLNVITDRYLMFSSINLSQNTLSGSLYKDLSSYDFQVNNIQTLDNGGTYLFSTDGVFYTKDFQLKSKAVSIPFIIKNHNKDSKIQLIQPTNSFVIELESISYNALGKVMYRYRLENQKNNEKSQYIYTNDSKIIINDLPIGKYKIYIESSNNIFSSFGNGQYLNVTISPSIFETAWFRIVVVIIIISLILITIYVTKALVNFRTRRKIKIKELELRALRAQLNPHFIFNVLNSIQGIMFYENKEKANKYIHSFSELIRSVLNNSRQLKVSLADELKLINNYLELENMRFNNTLTYSIENHFNVEPESIPVYGMVIQPFVENCIIHGFKTNQKDKCIKIDCNLIGHQLKIQIEDNGIGREQASQMKKGTIHKSWASTILKEKSDLLNSINENELLIEIIDIDDHEGNTGTRVIIKMNI